MKRKEMKFPKKNFEKKKKLNENLWAKQILILNDSRVANFLKHFIQNSISHFFFFFSRTDHQHALRRQNLSITQQPTTLAAKYW